MNQNKNTYLAGSLSGLILSVGIGFVIYFALNRIYVISDWLDYNTIVSNADNHLLYKLVWFLMNFTEADFYAGFFASLGLILGGFVAWRLDVKKIEVSRLPYLLWKKPVPLGIRFSDAILILCNICF